MIVLASVMHTGTRFVQHSILGDFYFSPTPGVKDRAMQAHIAADRLKEIQHERSRGALIVVPLRHPVEIYRSWARRNRSIDFLEEQLGLLCGRVVQWEPFFLPLDTEDRELQLNALGLILGREFKTDWSPVGHLEGEVELSADLEKRARRWLEHYPFSRYYDEP